jgi:hypothetical protein
VEDTYTVEVLNLGKRPMPGVAQRTAAFDDRQRAVDELHRAVGELVLHPGVVVLGADLHEDGREDGVQVAVRLTSEVDGGRVEVLLRRRASPGSR